MSDAFTDLLARALAPLRPIPIVSPEQYRAIECNRCGLCCEDIVSPDDPDRLAWRVADDYTEPDRRRFLSFLEPVAQTPLGWRYRCRNFSRDEVGLGVCAIHETRPDICRNYPYGQMVRQWVECAWYVEVRDALGSRVERVSCI